MIDSLDVSIVLIDLTRWLTIATCVSAFCAAVLLLLTYVTYRHNRVLTTAYFKLIPFKCATFVTDKESVQFKHKRIMRYEISFRIKNKGREAVMIDEFILWYLNLHTKESHKTNEKPLLGYIPYDDEITYTISFIDEPTKPFGSSGGLQPKVPADFFFAFVVKYHPASSVLRFFKKKQAVLYLCDTKESSFSPINDRQYRFIKQEIPKNFQKTLQLI